MKTSHRIALSFTLFSSILLLIFGLVLNGVFLAERYRGELKELRAIAGGQEFLSKQGPQGSKGKPNPRQQLLNQFTRTITTSLAKEETKELLTYAWRDKSILLLDERQFIFVKDGENAHLREVTHFVKRQKNLFWRTIFSVSVFAFLSYLFGKKFTTYALRDLDSLAGYVKKLDLDSLTQEADFSHLPNDDKIKLVSNAIHAMQETIKHDVDRIKRFVSNVSHEFKTPLMMMQSTAELALVSKEYKTGLEKNIHETKRLHELLDALLEMTQGMKTQYIQKEHIHLESLIEPICESMKLKYRSSRILHKEITNSTTVTGNKTSLYLVCKNIIDNAYKYSPEDATITITYDDEKHTLSISNTGSAIPKEKVEHIREPFWQEDTSKEIDAGFGLGLALVKEAVEKQGWNIEAISKSSNGVPLVVFTIFFPK